MAQRRIATDRFGELVVDDADVIAMEDGLLGFIEVDEVVLLPVDDDGLFFWMQSLRHPHLAFLALTPWPLFPDYEPVLNDVEQATLGLDEASDAIVLCLVSSHGEPRRFTANLLGPVVINAGLRRGRQVVLEADLPTRAELPETR